VVRSGLLLVHHHLGRTSLRGFATSPVEDLAPCSRGTIDTGDERKDAVSLVEVLWPGGSLIVGSEQLRESGVLEDLATAEMHIGDDHPLARPYRPVEGPTLPLDLAARLRLGRSLARVHVALIGISEKSR